MNTCRVGRLPVMKIVRLVLVALIAMSWIAPPQPAIAETPAAAGCLTIDCIFLSYISSLDSCTADGAFRDPAYDVSAAYIDGIRLSGSFVGEVLTATLWLVDVPALLTFNRTGVPDGVIEYSWEILIDTDNNPATGWAVSGRGIDVILSADHTKEGIIENQDLAILNAVLVTTQIYEPGTGHWLIGTPGGLAIDLAGDTLTLTGTIPGLNANSRLMFYTYDFNPGGSNLIDWGICGN